MTDRRVTAEFTEKNFRKELKALLRKYDASLVVESYLGEGSSDVKLLVDIPAKYIGEELRYAGFDIDLGGVFPGIGD